MFEGSEGKDFDQVRRWAYELLCDFFTRHHPNVFHGAIPDVGLNCVTMQLEGLNPTAPERVVYRLSWLVYATVHARRDSFYGKDAMMVLPATVRAELPFSVQIIGRGPNQDPEIIVVSV